MNSKKRNKVFIFVSKFLEILIRYVRESLPTIFITSIGLIGSFASIEAHVDSLSSNVDCESAMSNFDNFIHCSQLIKFKTPFELASSSLKIIIWISFILSFLIFIYTIFVIFKNSFIETIT